MAATDSTSSDAAARIMAATIITARAHVPSTTRDHAVQVRVFIRQTSIFL